MGKVIIKPLARIETPDGPLYATEIDGARVHSGKPVTSDGRRTLSEIIAAARAYMSKQKQD